ncbi:autotransporter-associated beta strand repeat-containing protein, partial [Salmonella enterica]
MKSGDKTLTLSGTNSYTGGTTISGGTLVANNAEAR